MGRLRSSFLGALLLVALAVTAVVTYRAYTASRELRATVERVLNDYVTVAAHQMVRSMQTAMFECTREWLQEALRPVNAVAFQDLTLTACGNTGRTQFEIDLLTGTTKSWGGDLRATTAHWLRDTIPKHPLLGYRNEWSFGLLATEKSPSDLIVVAVHHPQGKKLRAIGFVANSAVQRIGAEVIAHSQMLPPDLTGGLADSAFFAVGYGSNATPTAAYSKAVTLGPEFASLGIDVTLKEASLGRIVPGGIPRDRGLELAGLLALAMGLVLSSLLLLEREAQLARARANFVSNVSHELRTPLAQIRMFAEMLVLGRVRNDAEQRRALQIIDKEARRLSQLVENVLQVARSENAAVRVNPTETLLAPVVRETAEGFMALIEAQGVELHLDLEERLIVSIDAAAVQQIVLNLIDNAAKYGPKGQRIVVGLGLFEGVARLWVDDEGSGVPIRERERVFEAFYRARRDLQSTTTGSGIGLAVVRELAVLHGGSAWIEDAPERGARVVVEFPGAYVAAEQHANDWAVA